MGQPALAVPMGFNAAGLPLSLQIAGRPFEDALVLKAGDAYQGATDWHLHAPPLLEAISSAA
jgi:aspartyl-tRNA(Asn)/glutamyl-tRNA(Gln) amidotransferase subunit A